MSCWRARESRDPEAIKNYSYEMGYGDSSWKIHVLRAKKIREIHIILMPNMMVRVQEKNYTTRFKVIHKL